MSAKSKVILSNKLKSSLGKKALHVVLEGDRSMRADDAETPKFQINGADILKRLTVPLRENIRVKEGKGRKGMRKVDTIVRGTVAMLRPGRRPGTVIVGREAFSSAEELRKIQKSARWKVCKALEAGERPKYKKGVKVKEQFDTFANDTTVSAAPPNDEFHPILAGPYSKQLYWHDYLDMHSKCFELRTHNPLAAEGVHVITYFTMGRGVKVVFNDDRVQAVWNDFEKRSRFQEKMLTDCDSLTWAGEIMTRKMLDREVRPTLKQIDPSTIWEIVTNPIDIEEVHYYHQQYPTQYQLIYHAGDVSSVYVIQDYLSDEIIHVKINVAPGEKRGRSDFFPVIGWLKYFKDYYRAKVTKAQIEESYAMKKKVTGDANDVAAILADEQLLKVPEPGSVIVENESVDTTFLTPTTSSGGGRDNTGEQIRGICATGMGLSPEYLGVSGLSSNRSTALQHSEPSTRKFENRQFIMERYMREIADWVLDVEKTAGNIPDFVERAASMKGLKQAVRDRNWTGIMGEVKAIVTGNTIEVPLDAGYEVIFPEISTDDRSQKLLDIQSAVASKFFSHERGSELTSKEFQVTNFNYEDEQEQVTNEMDNAAIQGALAIPPSQMAPRRPGAPSPVSQVAAHNFKQSQKK